MVILSGDCKPDLLTSLVITLLDLPEEGVAPAILQPAKFKSFLLEFLGTVDPFKGEAGGRGKSIRLGSDRAGEQ